MKKISILVAAFVFASAAIAQTSPASQGKDGTVKSETKAAKSETKANGHTKSQEMEHKSDVAEEKQSEKATLNKSHKHKGSKKQHVKHIESKEPSNAPAEKAAPVVPAEKATPVAPVEKEAPKLEKK